MRVFLAFLIAAGLAACAVPGPREPERYLILDAALAPRSAPPAGPPLAVAPTTAASFYDTQDIAFSREPGTRGYYHYSHWTERPQRAVYAQLAARLETPGAPAGLRLRTHLDEIFHDAASSPGTARITLTAELVDAGGLRARRTFRSEAPAASHDAAGAVRGFNQALAALIGDLESWVEAATRAK